MDSTMLNSIRSNNHRELSRAISHIENEQEISPETEEERKRKEL